MRTQDFFTYDACRVCGQTPCNCTHIQESYEARPVKDRGDFLNRREFLYRQLNTPGLSKQDRDVIRHAIQDLEASARAAGLVKEDLRKWFKEKWVRFGPDGKIRGDCARGDDSEGKPKCLPQSKAHALGKKGRASAAARKRRQDPNPERKGAAINVATKEAVGNAPQAAAQVDYALYSDGKPSVKMSDRLLAYKFLAALKRRFPEQKHEIRTVQRVQEMKCSECGGPAFSDLLLAEKKDACYNKVRSRYKVWPSAYASGALVQCRKKGAANWGNKSKNEGVSEGIMSKIANKVMGAAPEQPKYKVGQRVKYETSPHQPDWEDGGSGVGVISDYKNGHYMINGKPVNHFEIKGVVEPGVAEDSIDQRIAHAKKNNPLQASVRQHEYGYTALVTDANTGKPSWFGGAVWQTPELAMGHAKAFVKGFPYLEQRFAQRFVDKNFDGIADQGVAEVSLNEFAPGGDSASSYYAVTSNFVNEFAQQKQEQLQDLIDAGWTKQDLAQAGTLEGQAADIAHFEQVRDGFLKGLKPGFDAYLRGDTQLKDQLGAYWMENDLPLNQDWEKIYGEPWGRDEFNEGVAETMSMNDAVKVLRHYGAGHFKTTSNELHFYKNGRPMSVDLIWGDGGERSVNLSQLNSATRQLKGQGVAEGSEQEKPIKKSDWFDPTDMRSPEKQKAAYLNHLAAKKKNKNIKEQGVAEEQLDEKCWDTHKQVGMKNKGGRMVPNCVPKESKQPASAISAGIAKTRR